MPTSCDYLLSDALRWWGYDQPADVDWVSNSPSSVYFHIPFCRHRCGYCNFAVTANRDDMIDEYLDALEIELSVVPHGVTVETIFIGGGTPTLLPKAAQHRLAAMIQSRFHVSDEVEWSMEANPNDIDESLCETLCKLGVNRLSIGIQSFDEEKLRKLDRNHTAMASVQSLQVASKYFHNLSIDLIFAAPQESQSTWEKDLRIALDSDVRHLSSYGLTVEKGTRFWNAERRNQLLKPSETAELSMYERAIELITQAGYDHYEVSNFAKPGFRCRHNQVYWHLRGWWAFGAGAARSIGYTRSSNHASTRSYIKALQAQKLPLVDHQRLSHFDWTVDKVVFGMRTREGIDIRYIREHGDKQACDWIHRTIEFLKDKDLIECCGDTIKLSHQGLVVSDSIWSLFYSSPSPVDHRHAHSDA